MSLSQAGRRGHRVKHLRLFSCCLTSDSIAACWVLRHAGHYDSVEHIEVNITNPSQIPPSFSSRNHFAAVPFLEITFDYTSAVPPGTKKVSDLTPWKEEAPCTTQTADEKTIAEQNDRVLCMTEPAAICTFFSEHFHMTTLWNPRSVFQQCRVNELCAHTELLGRRMKSMVIVMIISKTAGTSDEDAVTGIAAHERELLWSFRIMEDMLTRSEEAAAHAAGLDYQELLAVGDREVEEQNARRAANPTAEAKDNENSDEHEQNRQDNARAEQHAEGQYPATTDQSSPTDQTATIMNRAQPIRLPASPTLVALDAFIAGTSLSIADFVVATDFQIYPYVQLWLPSSIKQARFPAIIRHLERMRSVPGYEEGLRPRLSFMKIFRRRPKIMAVGPTLSAHAERLRKLVDRIAADRAAKQEHGATNTSDGVKSEPTAPQATVGKRSRAQVSTKMSPDTVHPFEGGRYAHWAPCLEPSSLLPPSPCTLIAEDEAAVQASEPAVSKLAAKSIGRAHSRTSKSNKSKKAAASIDGKSSTEGKVSTAASPSRKQPSVPLRSATAQPQARGTHQQGPQQPTVWCHDPYNVHTVGALPLQANTVPAHAQTSAQARVRSTPPDAFRPPQRGLSAAAFAPPTPPLPASSFICSSVPQSLAVGHFFVCDPRNNAYGRI